MDFIRGIIFRGVELRKKIICIVMILSVITLFGYELYSSKFMLKDSYYTIETQKVKTRIRIVQLSDLHNSEFGKDNNRLIKSVEEKQPDLILITGDTIIGDVSELNIATTLFEQLTTIAPVYVSMGNHEIIYEENYGIDVSLAYEKTGVFILDSNYEDIIVNNNNIRIAGIYGYCFPVGYEVERTDESAFLQEFQNSDSLKILLAHLPLGWYHSGSLDNWDIDIVFSGHTHGGHIRLPFIGGLYATDLGLFPGKEEGLYYSKDKRKILVLSKGLGSSEIIPRFNNIPEIVVVDLVPEGE